MLVHADVDGGDLEASVSLRPPEGRHSPSLGSASSFRYKGKPAVLAPEHTQLNDIETWLFPDDLNYSHSVLGWRRRAASILARAGGRAGVFGASLWRATGEPIGEQRPVPGAAASDQSVPSP